MESPRELCCEIHSALCNALGYLDVCLDGDVPSDTLREVLGRLERQVKTALEAEQKLFIAIGADKVSLSPSQNAIN